MPFPDSSYDAVFDIATLHHVTDLPDSRCGWRWVLSGGAACAQARRPLLLRRALAGPAAGIFRITA
jgi:hypothetical protein